MSEPPPAGPRQILLTVTGGNDPRPFELGFELVGWTNDGGFTVGTPTMDEFAAGAARAAVETLETEIRRRLGGRRLVAEPPTSRPDRGEPSTSSACGALPPRLSEEARAARAPRPTEELVGALQDRIHRDDVAARAAHTARSAMTHERELTPLPPHGAVEGIDRRRTNLVLTAVYMAGAPPSSPSALVNGEHRELPTTVRDTDVVKLLVGGGAARVSITGRFT